MSWRNRKFDEAITIVNRWIKKYPTDTVRLFVEDALSVTRSPGKIEVYKAWLTEHPTSAQESSKLVSKIWANKLANHLGIPRQELGMVSGDPGTFNETFRLNYLSNGSVTEYGGLVGDKFEVPTLAEFISQVSGTTDIHGDRFIPEGE